MSSSSVLSKAKIPVAAAKRNKFFLPQVHVTTGSFMRFFPACVRNVVKSTDLKVEHSVFIRTVPLDKPFYGNVNIHDRAFFVPYRVVWEPFEDFRNNVPHNQSSGTTINTLVPDFSLETFWRAIFVDGLNDFCVVKDSNDYDFKYGNDYFKLTSNGRAALSLMEALGYKFFMADSIGKTFKYNVLNLLSVAKIYLDWYFPSAYAHYGLPAFMDGILQRQFYYSLTSEEIYRILKLILYVSYDSDFYTSLFDNPVGPNSGAGSLGVNFNITDSTVVNITKSLVTLDSNGTPVVRNANSNTVPNFSQYVDKSLQALTSYVARHRMAGSRSLDRALASYGVMLSAEKLKRCYYLGSNEYPLHVADVMSTAETQEASLGAYAGKAVASSTHTFDSYSDEDGLFVIINSVVPQPIYYQGVDQNTLCRSVLDFHNGEFDNLGPVMVTGLNVCASVSDSPGYDASFNDVVSSQLFGYAPRYYWLKIPYNRVSGDFMFKSVNTDLKSWLMVRAITPPPLADVANFKHNLDFVLGANDAEQYKNVFLQSTDDSTDVFRISFRDLITMRAPMKPLYDTFEFDEDDKSKMVTTEPNGVKMN